MRRREFLKAVSAATLATAASGDGVSDAARPGDRPNILWISCEDMSLDLGCYGDAYAIAPHLDRLATQGVRYTRAFTHAGVCAPSRSGLITGMYPSSIGTHHMRCKGVPPPQVRCFTEYLRAAGYYCTNRQKTDYQFDPPSTAWDECGPDAHWRGRDPKQPFFAVINLTVTHESQARSSMEGVWAPLDTLAPNDRHDPDRAELPPYYPDTPEVRKDWAQYHDTVTLMDRQAAGILEELEADGLAANTIVWFWADHGRGLPRAKRWLYDSGIHVPLIIRVPEALRELAAPGRPERLAPGAVNDELVAFVDFAPTMLALAGVALPEHFQGRPFLGPHETPPRSYVYGARDRMDEAYDVIRAVRDERFKYIRNYMPHVGYGQNIDYMNMMPTMKEMRRLNAEGGLTGAQKLYFRETKPIEELYDTLEDPHEVNDLAGDPTHHEVLERMRHAHLDWMREIGDIGLIPEPEFDEMKLPGGERPKTDAPTFKATSNREGVKEVALSCATPGASIGYAVGDGPWRLYTAPVPVAPADTLRARAVRIGFGESDEVVFDAAGLSSADERRPGPTIAHWRRQVDETDLLGRLATIKALDGWGSKAIPAYLDALGDDHAAVRYWAVVGLHTACREPDAVARAKERLEGLLKDPSPVVRIAVAQALCDWGEAPGALGTLTDALGHPRGAVRLYAITALDRLGEKARPALTAIEAAANDDNGYVTRVVKYTLERLAQGQL